MTRPKKPATETIKKIYALLIGGSFYFEDIYVKTGLHRNTVATTLDYLVEKRMISRERRGRKVFYDIIKTQPPYFGWEILWVELMTTEQDKKMIFKRMEQEVKKSILRRKTKDRVHELYKRSYETLIEPEASQEFIKVLQSINHPITLRLLLNNLQNPFCLECLRLEKIFCRLVTTSDGELSCERCGTTFQNSLLA